MNKLDEYDRDTLQYLEAAGVSAALVARVERSLLSAIAITDFRDADAYPDKDVLRWAGLPGSAQDMLRALRPLTVVNDVTGGYARAIEKIEADL